VVLLAVGASGVPFRRDLGAGHLATVIAVGLTGSDVSFDGGLHRRTFDTGQFDTVSCAPDGSCWASGDLGRVAILQR